MVSRSKFEDMIAYPGELVSAVKQARSDIAERKAKEKSRQLQAESESRLSAKREEAPQEKAKPAGRDITLGGAIEQLKKKKEALSSLD